MISVFALVVVACVKDTTDCTIYSLEFPEGTPITACTEQQYKPLDWLPDDMEAVTIKCQRKFVRTAEVEN